MKPNLITRRVRTVLSAVLVVIGLYAPPKASAGVPYPNDLYLTQQSDVTCTLVSNAMMLRARTYLSNNSNWTAITEASLMPYGWINGAGQRSNYSATFGNCSFTVNQAYVNGLTVAQLQGILDAHPEGVCIYVTSIPHAQWITDIENGIVYSGDSSCAAYFGRRPLSNTYQGQCCGYNQNTVLARVTSYWYVSSYNVPANTSYTTPSITQKKQNLPNGTYRIACYNNPTYGLDVAGGSTADEANVHIWEYSGAKQQQFNVTFAGDHYNIQAVHSGKNLDLYRAASAPGTNVQQYAIDGTDVQNWVLEEAGEGAFYIVNNNGLYMDVKDGIVSNSTNVQGYSGNKSNAQKWFFIAVDGNQSIPDGDYQIHLASNFGYGVVEATGTSSSGSNIHLWTLDNSAHHKWNVKYLGNGYYSIRLKHSDMALNLNGGPYKGYANAQQHPFTDNDEASMWMLKDAGDGSFYIVNKKGLFLDIYSAKVANGTNIGGWCGNSSDAQKWKFVAVNGTQTIKDGYYNIRSAKDNNFGVDVETVSKENSANVHLWTIGTGNNQKWNVKYLGDGYYSMAAAHSRKVLDMYGGGIDNGCNVQQYDNTAATNNAQQWIIKETGDGAYYIINKNGLFLDIENGTIADGTNIAGWCGNRTPAQKWVFTAVNVDKEPPVISNIKITNLTSSGYTVTCTVTDNEKVTSVKMPTWSVANDQDDIKWYEATANGNTATCDIKTSNHNNETGVYLTHIYAEDDLGNTTNTSAGEIDVPVRGTNPDRLPDGVYRIACYSNVNYGLDVANASTADEANVIISEYSGRMNQQFNVTYSNGYYHLQALHSGKNLDLYKAGSASGTNVQQYSIDGTEVQNWALRSTADGTYFIVNSNGLYMDVTNGTMADGVNVQGHSGNQSDAQKWIFIAVNGGQSIPDGDYQIRLAKDFRYGVGVQDASTSNSANVQLQRITGEDNQKWSVKYLGNGYYSLTAKHSDMSLNLYGKEYKGSPNILQHQFTEGDDASEWILRNAGAGNFYIINKCGRFADVSNGVFVDGTNINGWTGNSSDAQKFKFVAVDGGQSLYDGIYQIRNSSNRNLVLDVDQASTDNSANVKLSKANGGDSQKWRISYLGDGYYSIVAVHSDKALDMQNAGIDNNCKVQQYENSAATNDAQQWIIKEAGDKEFYIIHKNGLFLDVVNGTIADGSGIQGFVGNRTDAQRWVFTDADSGDISGIDTPAVGKAIEKVEYYDVNGRLSEKPYEGFNLIVTIYDDGTKEVKKAFVK